MTKQEGIDLAKKYNFLFSEASAEKKINIKENFENVTILNLEKRKEKLL